MDTKYTMKILAVFLPLCTFSVNGATLFMEDFSDNSAGWTLGPEWEIGSATASTGHNTLGPDPATDHTATADNGVAGVNIGGNTSTNSLHLLYFLTSPTIDTSVAGTVTLEYWRWLNSDHLPYMNNVVEVYDGTSWSRLWVSPFSGYIQEDAWSQHLFDLTLYKSTDTRIRFGFSINNTGAFTVSSWNLDDISLYTSPVPVPAAVWLFGTALIGFISLSRRTRVS